MTLASETTHVATLLSSKEGLKWRRVHHSKARLESTKRTSIILAIFSYSVFTSLQLNYPTACPPWIFTVLAVNSALLVAMHSFAFIISTFLLPKLKAVVQEYKHPVLGDTVIKPVPAFSPHDRLSGFVLFSYTVSHFLGLFLFLLEIPLVAWVKFYDVSIAACIASTVIVCPAAVVFAIFCWYFHRCLTMQIYHTREHLIEDVEREFTRSEETLASCVPDCSSSKRGNILNIAEQESHHSLPPSLTNQTLYERNLKRNFHSEELLYRNPIQNLQ